MMGERVVIDGEYEKPWRAARERIGMIFRAGADPGDRMSLKA